MVWSQDFETEPYTVWSHQKLGTILQFSLKNLRLNQNFSVQSSLDWKSQSGLGQSTNIFDHFTTFTDIFDHFDTYIDNFDHLDNPLLK